MHWVIFSGLAGAYQYFVNRALPVLGEFRTLWRLDNTTFTKGKTDLRDELLPPLSEYLPQNKVQDETWLKPDGSGYITKYDFTSWVRNQKYYGVYGEGFGSWYINAGKDYYNGDQLKQELMVIPQSLIYHDVHKEAHYFLAGPSRILFRRCSATEHDPRNPFHGLLLGRFC